MTLSLWIGSSQSPESFSVYVLKWPSAAGQISAHVHQQMVIWVVGEHMEVCLVSHVEVGLPSTQEVSACFRLVVCPPVFDVRLDFVVAHHEHVGWDGNVAKGVVEPLTKIMLQICVAGNLVGINSRLSSFPSVLFNLDSCAPVLAETWVGSRVALNVPHAKILTHVN